MSGTVAHNSEIGTIATPPEIPTWTPRPPLRPGPEMQALRRFHFDCQWVGTVEPNGMGPGSPAMPSRGTGIFTPLMDGLWLAGDFEQQQFLNGEVVITWQAHYVVGWDARAGEYKVTYVDNNGSSALMRGYVDGERFVVETMGDAPLRLRLVWESMGDGRLKWGNWMSPDGDRWTLIEEYICVPL